MYRKESAQVATDAMYEEVSLPRIFCAQVMVLSATKFWAMKPTVWWPKVPLALVEAAKASVDAARVL